MKKIIMLLMFAILLLGCSFHHEENKIPQAPATVLNDISSLEKQDYIILDASCYQDKLVILYVANGNTEIPKSKIAVVDSNDYNILAEKDDDNLYIFSQIVTTDNGFYINNGSNIVIYDYQLNIIQNIQTEATSNEARTHVNNSVMAISDDFSQLAYVDSKNNTLKVKNIDTGNEKEIYKLSTQIGNMMAFDQIYFYEDYIAFAGKYVYADDFEISGSNAYGRINIQTLEIDFNEKNETTTKFIDGHMLIIDLMRSDDSDNGTGETIIYDVKNNESEIIKLDYSYNSFNLDFPSSDMVISYSDIGRNTAKFIMYKNGKSEIKQDIIPENILEVGTCYDKNNKILIIFYLLPEGEDVRSEIKGVELS